MLRLRDPWHDGLRARWGDVWRAWRDVLESSVTHDAQPIADRLAHLLGLAGGVFVTSGYLAREACRRAGVLVAWCDQALWSPPRTGTTFAWDLADGTAVWPCGPLGFVGSRDAAISARVAEVVATLGWAAGATATSAVGAVLPSARGRMQAHWAAARALVEAFPGARWANHGGGWLCVSAAARPAVIAACAARGIECVAAKGEGVMIPCRPGLSRGDVARVVESVRDGAAACA
ncbi:MAG: hypothetical protein Q8O71_01690 [bacterium]|nr:hypothetical protein [bacterium]